MENDSTINRGKNHKKQVGAGSIEYPPAPGQAIHLSHKLKWEYLIKPFFQFTDDPTGIQLPTCECGRINTKESKKVQHQISNRFYLHEYICKSEDCKTVEIKTWYKSTKGRYDLRRSKVNRRFCICKKCNFSDKYGNVLESEVSINLTRFADSFIRTVQEFARTSKASVLQTNRPKLITDHNVLQEYCSSIIKKSLKQEYLTELCGIDNHCPCRTFVNMIEVGDIVSLLSFPKDHIKSVFSCTHTLPAIGRNIQFLLIHIVKTYLYINLIYLLNVQESPSEWGPFSPEHPFFSCIQYDCDGMTFPRSCRRFLDRNTFIKDQNASKELLKELFKFLYLIELVHLENIGESYDWENILELSLF